MIDESVCNVMQHRQQGNNIHFQTLTSHFDLIPTQFSFNHLWQRWRRERKRERTTGSGIIWLMGNTMSHWKSTGKSDDLIDLWMAKMSKWSVYTIICLEKWRLKERERVKCLWSWTFSCALQFIIILSFLLLPLSSCCPQREEKKFDWIINIPFCL